MLADISAHAPAQLLALFDDEVRHFAHFSMSIVFSARHIMACFRAVIKMMIYAMIDERFRQDISFMDV